MTNRDLAVVAPEDDIDEPPSPPFDYGQLDAEVATLARTVADRIRMRTVMTAVEHGRDLLQVKARMQHGQFLDWVGAEFGLSERTARKLMAVAQLVEGKSEHCADLLPSVLYALAARSTPESVRQDVFERAESGAPPTLAEVKALIEQARAEERAAAADRAAADLKSKQDALDRLGRALVGQEDVLQALRDRAVEAERALEQAKAAGRIEAETALRADLDRLAAEAEWARTEAEAARRAKTQAEKAVDEAAAAKAKALTEEELARRKAEVDRLTRKARRAEDDAQIYTNRIERLKADVKRHQDYLKTVQSAEAEQPSMLEAGKRLMSALADALITVAGYEHPPQPPALRQWLKAQEMCRDLAEAVDRFVAPRLDGRAPPLDGEAFEIQ